MVEDAPTGELREAEGRLRAAMLAGDVGELDRLLDDRLIAVGPPDGGRVTKQDDLELHHSRRVVLAELVQEDLAMVVRGRTGATLLLATVTGTNAGTPFSVRLRYTRTWTYDDEHGWHVLAAHISPA